MIPPANIKFDPKLIYDAKGWAAWISASLPTFKHPEIDFDHAHEAIEEWVQMIIDAVLKDGGLNK